MGMPLKAKQEIQREAFFLEKVGYRKTEDENSISYAQNELVFLISFLPNSEESDIMIHFKKENQSFSVGWIALVREGIKGDGEKTKNVIQLLRYIESHYNLITDFQYCALPGFVDSKNEEKTERNAGYLVVSHSGGGMLRQGTRKGIRRTPANRGMRAHRIVKGLDISEDVCHGMCP